MQQDAFHAVFCLKITEVTYRELEWEVLSSGVETVVLWCGSFGEEGKEESVISSMSEWEDADLGDFFFPKACLKELRNWKKNKTTAAGPSLRMKPGKKKPQSKNCQHANTPDATAILTYKVTQVKNKKSFFSLTILSD